MHKWLGVALLWFVASPASADAILVVQRQGTDIADETAGPGLAALLEDLGHDVTTAFANGSDPVLPTDLSVFDTIWVIQTGAVPGVVETRLVEYVNNGGGLVITGERSCCSGINASVQNITNRLTSIIGTIRPTGSGMSELTAVPGERYGVSTTPNAVPAFEVGEPGQTSGYPEANQIYRDADGTAMVLGFFGEELRQGGGCLLVVMDLSVWRTDVLLDQDKEPFTENFQHFASTCGDTDGDGASDYAETRAGTGVEDPDSDDDGLCDGYGRVEGVCIPGESIFANSDAEELPNRDSDDLIDALDPDDDGDGIPTRDEIAAELAAPDADDDDRPTWLDVDSDGNNILDRFEGLADRDGDGIPGFVQLGDNPENCDSQEDCEPFGETCDLEIGWCQVGASVTDAGISVDASMFDGGGERVDGGVAPGVDAGGAVVGTMGGCGCNAPGGSGPMSSVVALVAILMLRMRRRRACVRDRRYGP